MYFFCSQTYTAFRSIPQLDHEETRQHSSNQSTKKKSERRRGLRHELVDFTQANKCSVLPPDQKTTQHNIQVANTTKKHPSGYETENMNKYMPWIVCLMGCWGLQAYSTFPK